MLQVDILQDLNSKSVLIKKKQINGCCGFVTLTVLNGVIMKLKRALIENKIGKKNEIMKRGNQEICKIGPELEGSKRQFNESLLECTS